MVNGRKQYSNSLAYYYQNKEKINAKRNKKRRKHPLPNNRPYKKCEHCSKRFKPINNPNQKFCSIICTNKQFKQKNKEKVNEYKKKWLNNNKEKRKEIANRWYHRNKEKLSEKKRKYSLPNNRLNKKCVICDIIFKPLLLPHPNQIYCSNLCNKKRFNRSLKGRKISRKTSARRRRELGYFELFKSPFPRGVFVEYHHINNLVVVPLPKNAHAKTTSSNTKNHHSLANALVKKLYGLDCSFFEEVWPENR